MAVQKMGSLKHIVEIYDVWLFVNFAGPVQMYGILQEKVTPLSSAEKSDIEDLSEFANVYGPLNDEELFNAFANSDWEQMKKIIYKLLWDDVAKETGLNPNVEGPKNKIKRLTDIKYNRIVDLYEKYKLPETFQDLKKIGVKFTDYHEGNVMKRGSDYVLIDLGVSEVEGGGNPPKLEQKKIKG
jgi:hypothetical protein